LDNRLYGNDNNNTLNGGDGADIIGGLGGDDHLIGGASRDIINDFTQGQDTIDVSAIDADSVTGG
jgi:Ca2+-binding RTX toxin-like protein